MSLSPLVEKVKRHVCDHFQLGEDQVADMLPAFLATLQSHMGNLEEALAANDPKDIGRIGHMLKGALLNLGLEDMAAIAYTIELEGKAGTYDADFSGLVSELKEKLAEII